MARAYAKINSTIWQDDDFRALPPSAQHLYFMVLTDPDLSYCGGADWRPKRILTKAADWTLDDLHEAAVILTEKRLLLINEETEEVVVRSFLRHDGVMQHNKLAVSATRAITSVHCNTLRGALIYELARLESEFPEWPTWAHREVQETLKRNTVEPASVPPLVSRLAPGSAPGLGPNVTLDQDPLYTGTGTSTNTPKERAPRAKSKRAIPDDWQPTEAHTQTSKEKNLDILTEAEAFRNHAHSNDRQLVNWNAAFSNWLLRAYPKAKETSTASFWDRKVTND